jgi:uncharacterized membrane protein YcaP (DUF421 family)
VAEMPEYINAIFHTALAFTGLFIYARLLGKHQMSQLTFYDYVAGITLGELGAAIALDRGDNIWLYLWILTLFFLFTYGIGFITSKSRPLRKIFDGEPMVLIHKGNIMEQNLTKARYNLDDLMMQLRAKDCFNINEVEFAIAETDGTLTVLKKSQYQHVTPDDLDIDTKYEGVPVELIVEGKIIYSNLQKIQLGEKWLLKQLKGLGIKDPKKVYYASLDTDHNLYVDEYRDE